jgi:midasin
LACGDSFYIFFGLQLSAEQSSRALRSEKNKYIMDCSAAVTALLTNVHSLPPELVAVIQSAPIETFLYRIAEAALAPRYADEIFAYLKPLYTEICGRWLQGSHGFATTVAAFGRILPYAPHLVDFAEEYLSQTHQDGEILMNPLLSPLPAEELLAVLLGVFRLLVFDNDTFARFLNPSSLSTGLAHESKAIRYLTIRIMCLYLHAADAAMENMISRYIGADEEGLDGVWDTNIIDYRFLSLWEEQRSKRMKESIQTAQATIQDTAPETTRVLTLDELLPTTAVVSSILLPRLQTAKLSSPRTQDLVPTKTTFANLRSLAEGLLTPDPLLLAGAAGAGKTSCVINIARHLRKLDKMVTLHLNEQTDAKLLIGMYTSGAKPGTFVWKAGALTTAVREGRWVFIEDLDRAPSEIMSTLLPLVENRELLIPGRGEVIRAARGFKVIATMRTVSDLRGGERLISPHLLGLRFWRQIRMNMLDDEELSEVVRLLNPTLEPQTRQIIAVYSRLRSMARNQSFGAQVKSGAARTITPRDLLKWCRRINGLVSSASEFSEDQLDGMFLEGLDCFAGYLPPSDALGSMAATIAEELHIDPSRRDYLCQSREVKLLRGIKGSKTVRIGRARIPSNSSRPNRTSRRPFAMNTHTLRLLERIGVAIEHREPLLLVGETGTGKTTCIQHLADQLGRRLVPFNLSQQSESSDLIGGFKPVNMRALIMPLKDEFEELFQHTFSQEGSRPFSEKLAKLFARGKWKNICDMWKAALGRVEKIMKADEPSSPARQSSEDHPKKRQKTTASDSTGKRKLSPEQKDRWLKFGAAVRNLESQLSNKFDAFAFTFVEGALVKAVRNGDWLLLDEINLASPDTLEALVDLLNDGTSGNPFLLITEAGDLERVEAHPNFRVFAAMNPATDVGKKDLPAGIRSRFTEIYVESPDRDVKSLHSIIESYLGENLPDRKIVADIADLYLKVQALAESNGLIDGAGQKPHFSLRTLTRTLSYARDMRELCSLRRAIYEGFLMSFSTLLDKASAALLTPLILQYIFGEHQNLRGELRKPLQQPKDSYEYIRETSCWLRRGSFDVEDQPHYIVTPFVRRNLDNLIRAISTRKYPILLQGPTSSGKTSMIEYLAKRSGNRFVRINNHEHTDLQEYLGTYTSDTEGKLKFQEGILVEALRNGYWIVLDELNLAPTDVLEALNRLLDDNRELLIPETQEVVRPHPDFMLFATQNPAGLYGGRKHLSRAFRNRFLELHFDDIPVDELCEILHRRTQIPESWARRIVDVYRELSNLRQETRLFEQKSFATLRDLFRWALRKADTVDHLAINGYMLLAERVRKNDERVKVKEVIEDVISRRGPKVRIDESLLYSETSSPEMARYNAAVTTSNVTWTNSMRRLFVLVAHALRNNEPVLLVGETGCGKTTVCQMLADALEKQLFVLNAHQNTETGDLIGSQRPIRNRAATETRLRGLLVEALQSCGIELMSDDIKTLLLSYDSLSDAAATIPAKLRQEIKSQRTRMAALFEWHDGSLVEAMKAGQLFLLDEISLADDSVLERLNSVLEPARSLLLAEKGPIDSFVTAADGFQFLATMNPGGDYGKRELSPALRNRFTEIWVPSVLDVGDVLKIVRASLKHSRVELAEPIVYFAQWFIQTYNTSASSSISIRDVLAWVNFVNAFENSSPGFSLLQGAAMVFIDTIGANPAAILSISAAAIDEERQKCIFKLGELVGTDLSHDYRATPGVDVEDDRVAIGPFALPAVARYSRPNKGFSFNAKTTKLNAMRLFRALQIIKPILIEGNPGVGKTTLVAAISDLLGKKLVRINLSEQTDLMDLFGSDVPVEGANAGTFAWRDAPFLSAMKDGDWVLLDEMNLASQSVLEGLNACLDHRGEAYISELNQTFKRHPDFRIFAAQNPHHQGGGRKGLPASFVNRFTVVYADVFKPDDLMQICKQSFSYVADEQVASVIKIVDLLDTNVVQHRKFGALGGPWEFNLRDSIRWLQLVTSQDRLLGYGLPYDFCDIIFRQRFRSEADRAMLDALFEQAFGTTAGMRSFYHNMDSKHHQVGLGLLLRDQHVAPRSVKLGVPVANLACFESLMLCVQRNWPVILVGPPGSGKSSLLEHLAAVAGQVLVTFPMNADIDAMDLVGGFEQADPIRHKLRFLTRLKRIAQQQVIQAVRTGDETLYEQHLQVLKAAQLGRVSQADFMKYRTYVQKVMNDGTQLLSLLHACDDAIAQPEVIEQAQFEWVDGLLVQAMEEGYWLVLDNANLCSSSVLDRLNSLLEPNGYLSINEHPMENGAAKIIHPHENFRIFLTMDPRNGELSRAMRNRSIELFITLKEEEVVHPQAPPFILESAMYRFRHAMLVQKDPEDNSMLAEIAADHLSFGDLGLGERFGKELNRGLRSGSSSEETRLCVRSLQTIWAQDNNLASDTLQWRNTFTGYLSPQTQVSTTFDKRFGNTLIMSFVCSPFICSTMKSSFAGKATLRTQVLSGSPAASRFSSTSKR